MAWSIINETGFGQGQMPVSEAGRLLHHPICAQRSDDGTYLIVDELAKERLVPYSFGCRTIRVSADGHVLYDSLASGIDDGYGCLLDDGSIAILRRTKWELLMVSATGRITERLYLDAFSKRLPMYLSLTCNGTFLIVFSNHAYDLDII